MTQQQPDVPPPLAPAALVAGRGGSDDLTPAQARTLRLRLTLSRLSLGLERLLACFWPFASALGLALALALSDLVQILPGWGHAAVLVVMFCLLLALFGWGERRFAIPTLAQAQAFAEQPFPHRPLTALADHPALLADNDPVALALWQAHHRRVLKAALAVPARGPRPVVGRADRWGLRVLAALALVLVAPVAHDDPFGRFIRALQPSLSWSSGSSPAGTHAVTVWLTPPTYTGQVPLRRDLNNADAIRVPEGTQALVLVHGADSPRLVVGALTKDIPPVTASADRTTGGDFRLETRLQNEGTDALRITDGRHDLARWPLEVIKDQPPRIELSPQEAPDPSLPVLALPYQAHDDYGLTELRADITGPSGETRSYGLPMAPPARKGEGVSYQATARLDLSSDPWAGREVDVRLVASDAGGASASGAPQRMILPERTFRHPVARAIADWRRQLLDDYISVRPLAMEGLSGLSLQPGAYQDDTIAFLSLRVAVVALSDESEQQLSARLSALLWQTAVRIEDDQRAGAEQRLAEAEQALDDAIAQGADPQTIAQRVEDLRQAVQDYLKALLESPEGQQAFQGLSPEDLRMVEHQQAAIGEAPQDLNALLEQLRDLEAAGAHDAAAALRQKIREMLAGLRSAQTPDPKALKAFQQTQQALNELTRDQQALLDESFQHGQKESRSPNDPGATQQRQALAERQQALHQRLAQTMLSLSEFGAMPQSLADAEALMGGATQALQKGQWGLANTTQGQIIEALRSGKKQAGQQMMQAMGKGRGSMILPGNGQGGNGRGQGGNGLGALGHDDGSVKIPKAGEISRGRDILMELRRRANDLSRPQEERDYINRLLQQF